MTWTSFRNLDQGVQLRSFEQFIPALEYTYSRLGRSESQAGRLKIKVLMADFEASELHKTRAAYLGNDSGSLIKEQIENNISELKEMKDSWSDIYQIEVSLYSCFPPFLYISFSNGPSFVGFLFATKQASRGPMIEIDRDDRGNIGHFKREFRKIWGADSTKKVICEPQNHASSDVKGDQDHLI